MNAKLSVKAQWVALLYLHQDDACLIWPFGIKPDGYPRDLWFKGVMHRTPRIICLILNGSPLFAGAEAAHECGNRLCVNPKHISWKTHTENMEDTERHGTRTRGMRMGSAKLTDEKVREIRRLNGSGPSRKIGSLFGVNHKTIQAIWRGETWRHVA